MGGKVLRIAWDPTGTRIAVTYRTVATGPVAGAADLTGPLVVIFSVAWQPFLIFTRRWVEDRRIVSEYVGLRGGRHSSCLVALVLVLWEHSGLLRGPPNAGVPREVAFASSFEGGALLGVAWSKGLVTFHPFYLQSEP